jgi:hypothetical protein
VRTRGEQLQSLSCLFAVFCGLDNAGLQ